MQPRYFIGITLPNSLRHQVGKVQHELFRPGKIMQPLKPHITLLHPDVLMTSPPLYFVPKIKEVADKILPIEITLTKTGMFDKRVLYIEVESPDLLELQKELIGLLSDAVRAQYTIGRPYRPHVTLAQAKPKQDLSPELIEAFKARIDPLLPQTFTANNLDQFKWLRPRIYKITKI